jgi:Zn-dependent peptidase ImmA (M78 family)/DNA-binding XRE family transcriptional regulator
MFYPPVPNAMPAAGTRFPDPPLFSYFHPAPTTAYIIPGQDSLLIPQISEICKLNRVNTAMATIGERIKAARILAGLSQDDLGGKLGVTKMAISKYENGGVIPNSTALIALSKALDIKIEYFFRSMSVTLSKPSYRCRKALAQKEETRILGKTTEWLERYLMVEHLTDTEKPLTLPKPEHCRIKTVGDIEKIAHKIRKEWNLGSDPIENIMDVLEQHGIKVGVVEAPESFDALTLWYNDKCPVIVVNKHFPGDRQRYNLAHELGHLVLHIESDLETEIAAHRFAGAFLVPDDMAVRELGPQRNVLDFRELYILKHKYGMSMAAWIHRAVDLGIITQAAAKRHWIYMRTKGWHKIEPHTQVPAESPTLMRLLLYRAVSENTITRSRFAELLGEDLAKAVEPCA